MSDYTVNATLSPCIDAWSQLASPVKVVQIFAFLSIVVISVGGNFVVLKTILTDRDMRKVYCNIFIINLALCDIVQATLGMPPLASVLVFDSQWLLTFQWGSDVLCKLAKVLNRVVPAVASYTNVIIAVDRLVGVLRPFRTKIPRHYALALTLLTWLFSLSFGIFYYINSYIVTPPCDDGFETYCYTDFTPQQFNM